MLRSHLVLLILSKIFFRYTTFSIGLVGYQHAKHYFYFNSLILFIYLLCGLQDPSNSYMSPILKCSRQHPAGEALEKWGETLSLHKILGTPCQTTVVIKEYYKN